MFADLSKILEVRDYCPRRLHATLSPAQRNRFVVELRKTLLLPLYDLLAVTHEPINDRVSRSGLDRCLPGDDALPRRPAPRISPPTRSTHATPP